MNRLRNTLLAVVIGATAVLMLPAPARAYEPVNIVHTEVVRAGPYEITVGFSVWPLRAMQSLDFSFIPAGGIAGKTGTLTTTGPDFGDDGRHGPLVRHPRRTEVWGLDVFSINVPGSYIFGFDVDGPQGPGHGELAGLRVLDQPGPPLALSWLVCAAPLIGLVVFLTVAWRRSAPRRQLPALV